MLSKEMSILKVRKYEKGKINQWNSTVNRIITTSKNKNTSKKFLLRKNKKSKKTKKKIKKYKDNIEKKDTEHKKIGIKKETVNDLEEKKEWR